MRILEVSLKGNAFAIGATTTPVKEGKVTITMIDPATDKIIWQGWATDEIKSSNITRKEIQRNVRSIFKKFDVASR